MTHHVQFPPYLPRGEIDGEPHPVDAAERPVLGQRVPGIEYHVLAVVQRILRQKALPRNGNASQPQYSLLRTGPPPRSVLDVIRRGGVPYHPAVKVRLFIDFLVDRFSNFPSWDQKV
jgi:hypothetical protein